MSHQSKIADPKDNPVQRERDLIAEWLWKYANSPKWCYADTNGEIRHFVGHAMDYIKSGAYREDPK